MGKKKVHASAKDLSATLTPAPPATPIDFTKEVTPKDLQKRQDERIARTKSTNHERKKRNKAKA